jgi:hypothetical protein
MGQAEGEVVLLEAVERAARRASQNSPEGALRMADGGNQPRTRHRNLLALGADPNKVHMATRSRKGYWRMSQNEIVRIALNNRWLGEQGVPDMSAIWIALHYPEQAQGN